jgi:hypothetical protein
VDPAAIRGLAPPSLPPSGACLCLGSRVLYQPLHAVEGYTTPGLRLCRCPLGNLRRSWWHLPSLSGLRYDGDLSGKSPHASRQLTGHGHGHNIGVFASCHEAPGTVTQPHWRFPTDVLDACGWCCEAQWHMSADFRGIAIGPGAFDQGTVGLALASRGDASLVASLSRRGCRGGEAQGVQQRSPVLTPGEVAACGPGGTAPVYGTPRRAWSASTTGRAARSAPGRCVLVPDVPVVRCGW